MSSKNHSIAIYLVHHGQLSMLEIKLDRVRVRNISDRKRNTSELESKIPPTENEIPKS
jgi:hypothetical protein